MGKLKHGIETLDVKFAEQMGSLSKEHDSKHEKNHGHVLSVIDGCDARLREELAHVSGQHDAKHKDNSTKQRAALDDEIAKVKEELARFGRDHDDKHAKTRTHVTSSVESIGKQLRDDVSQLLGLHEEKHKEIRMLLPHHLELLESKLREETKEVSKTLLDMHARHQTAIDRGMEAEQKLWQEISQVVKDNDAKHKDGSNKMRSGLDATEAKLREELLFMSKEHDGKHARSHNHFSSLAETLDQKLQEEVVRSSEDHDLKRERGIAAVQGACDSALSSMDAAVREEMGRLKAHSDRSVENASNKHRSVVEALERKLTEAMARMSAEEEKKHDEHRQSLKMSNGELLTMLQNDIGQCTESVDVKLNELRMSSSVELSALREDVARAVTDMDGKCERGLDHTTSSFEALERKLDLESAARSEENSTERDVRSREVADLCGAVKSMQAWLTDVESMGTQRNEARTREFENVTARLSELKEHQFTLRSELIKHQEHIDHFKGFQVDKVTEELRKVVQDLALTSDHQGDKIKELESTLDGARET